MAGLLPSTPDSSAGPPADPRVVGLDSEAADDLLSAMASRTARDLLTSLHDEPATPSALAARVDTSLQNAQYHLGNLHDVGAIEIVDTAYSEKGREMKVYAPADKPLVVVAGDEADRDGLRSALARLLPILLFLGLPGILIHLTAGSSSRAAVGPLAMGSVAGSGAMGCLPSVLVTGGIVVLGGWTVIATGLAGT